MAARDGEYEFTSFVLLLLHRRDAAFGVYQEYGPGRFSEGRKRGHQKGPKTGHDDFPGCDEFYLDNIHTCNLRCMHDI